MSSKLWITYAWADDRDGDFSYLVQELRDIGVEAAYDRISLIPGRALWQQIADRISSNDLSAWAYLLTRASLESKACREELAYALERALQSRNRDFPLIGLLHGISIADVPTPLRVRLCINLADGNWRESVLAAVQNRPPALSIESNSPYVWTVHQPYRPVPNTVAIEIRPRFGEIHYWRASIPFGTEIVAWGPGPAGGGAISMVRTMVVEGGDGQVNSRRFAWFGTGDRLTSGTSAYLIFPGNLPDLVGFGSANEPAGAPNSMEFHQFSVKT
jgi:hypothetical protein